MFEFNTFEISTSEFSSDELSTPAVMEAVRVGVTRPPVRQTMFWVNYMAEYCERQESRYPDSAHPAQIRRVLERFTAYCTLRERQLGDIKNSDVDRYVAKRKSDKYRNKPLTNLTINKELGIINTCFAFAGPRESRGIGKKYRGYITEPPFGELLEVDELLPVSLSQAQISTYVEATKHAKTPCVDGCDPQKFWTTVLVLGVVSSLRRKALLRIPRPNDYTLLELRQIVLPAHLSKTRTEQRIPLPPDVVEIVASLPSKEGEPLLPWRDRLGRQMSESWFSTYLAKFQRLAGIPETGRIKAKYLRSTAATELSDHFSDSVAKKRLGHSPTSNVINTNYKAKRVSSKDRRASRRLAKVVMPHVKIQLRLFDAGIDAGEAS